MGLEMGAGSAEWIWRLDMRTGKEADRRTHRLNEVVRCVQSSSQHNCMIIKWHKTPRGHTNMSQRVDLRIFLCIMPRLRNLYSESYRPSYLSVCSVSVYKTSSMKVVGAL